MSVVQAARPLLENGDRMDRAEFHRRYLQRPDLHHVELIEGVVYMPSPINMRRHGRPQAIINSWLVAYETKHKGLIASSPASLFLDNENEPEPDAMLIREDAGVIADDGNVVGPPDLVVEIASSSVSRDLHQKLSAYERNGVREYIIWRVDDEEIDWFVLRDGRYARKEPDAMGMIESEQFPGLRLDIGRALAMDAAGVLAELQ